MFQGEDEDEYDSQDWDPTTYVALEVLDKFWYIVADICIAGLFCCTSYGSKGRAIALAAFLLFTLLAFVEFALSTWATVEQLLVRNSGDDYGDPYASRDRERKAQQDAVDADYVFLAYCCYSFVYFAGFVAVVVALASRGTNRKVSISFVSQFRSVLTFKTQSAAMLLTLAIIFINAQLVFYIARIALGMTANIEYLNPSLGVAFSVVEGVFYLATLFTLAVMGSQRLSLHTYT